jgi:hypothetical protein
MRCRISLASVTVEIGTRWCADAAEYCASSDQERARDWTNRTAQGVDRDRACQKKPDGRAERRRPRLGSDDPMPPESNPCDEHRGEESTEDSANPKTAFAERMTDDRSECAANATERASNKE